MTAIWINLVICSVLLLYLSGVLVVIGLLIAKVIERTHEKKDEEETFKKYKDY